MLSVLSADRPTLQEVIRLVRRRWRLRMALRGAAIVAAATLGVVVLATWGMDQLRFSDMAVNGLRWCSYAGLAGVTWWFLIRPQWRRITDAQIALYLEEHEPTLQAAVLSAVDLEGERGDGVSDALAQRVVELAMQRCREVEYGRSVEAGALRQTGGVLAGILAAGIVVGLLSPGFVSNGMPYLLSPLSSSTPENPYSVVVHPGDTLLARGADVLILATLNGFDSERVELVARRGDGAWERWPMTRGVESGQYELFLLELNEPTEYYVEASGVRSRVAAIDVEDLPFARQIDLEYRFPSYSGLAPRIEHDAGDIAALHGTEVRLTIHPTIATPAGRLIIDGEEPGALVVLPDGSLEGTVHVRQNGYYRIELEAVNGRMVPASPDFRIDVFDDQPPMVVFKTPGRDIKVTAIEEPFVEVEAEDDYGIGALDLMYSVNGGPEDTISLFQGGRGTASLTAGHTFYLEEFELDPGDLLAYYARVRDNRGPGGQQEAATDIYFMEIRPFRRDYRQADQGGGGGGGQGDTDRLDGSLSAQQRDVVAATFKLIRDRETFGESEYHENLATLALAQGRIRERVEAITRRLTDRGIVQADSSFRIIAEELPQAIEAMVEAEELLGRRDPDGALPPEQQGLQHLQRAEAAFNERQVQMGGNPGGGGGGGQANAEDLADLFELELDKLRNQYETVQRGRQDQADQEVDAALQRLRELAQRQQQENERMRRLSAQQSGAGGGGAANQRTLAEETEELARQLQRLGREQSNPEMMETGRRLMEAAEAMRRAAASRNGNTGQGRQALDQLREARRLLDRSQSARLGRDVDDALDRAEDLLDQQREMQEDVRRLPTQGSARTDQVRRLVERKEDMVRELQDLEARLDRMARESREDQPEAARELQGAAGSVRENRVPEKIRYSRGVVQQRTPEYASNFEEQIANNLEELRDRIQTARDNVGESDADRLTDALEDARDLVRGLESMRDRVGERAEQTGSGEERSQESSGERDGDAQPGAAPGQQGQEGTQGGEGRVGGGEPGQGQPGGQQGGTDRFAPGGGGWGWGQLDNEDVRQFRNEARERGSDARRLEQELRGAGVDTRNLSNILRRLQDLERARTYEDVAEVMRLQQAIIEGLKEFEYGLRREMVANDEQVAALSGSDDVPRGFRELVEEYYRELSKSGNNR